MRFIIFVIDGSSNSAVGNEIEEIDKFNEKLREHDQLILACGIAGPNESELIDNRGGAGLASIDSLFKESDFYSGFWIVNAESVEQASALAREGSRACNRRVELRRIL
jgi:hypothetical protein